MLMSCPPKTSSFVSLYSYFASISAVLLITPSLHLHSLHLLHESVFPARNKNATEVIGERGDDEFPGRELAGPSGALLRLTAGCASLAHPVLLGLTET